MLLCKLCGALLAFVVMLLKGVRAWFLPPLKRLLQAVHL